MACCTALSPASLPNGRVGSAYNQNIEAVCEVGGTATIMLFSGTLPPGLVFVAGTQAAPATISGTPTTSGTYVFSVRLTNTGIDPACTAVTIQYTIVINGARRRGTRRVGVYIPPEIIYVPKTNFPKGAPATITYQGFSYLYSGQNVTYYLYKRNGRNISGRTGWAYGIGQ